MMRSQQIHKALKQDILEGRFAKQDKLPTSKQLGEIYGISQPTVRQMMRNLIEEGVIVRHGAGYRIPSVVLDKTNHKILRLVTGGNSSGITLETPRELDFYKAVVDLANQYDLHLQVFAIDDWIEQVEWFDNQKNKTYQLPPMPSESILMGTLLSTWHLQDGHSVLSQILSHGQNEPVAIWAEHGLQQSWKQSPGIQKLNHVRFFDVAYGKRSGYEVGKILWNEGVRQIAFISPFHKAQWSQDRLAGLQQNPFDDILIFCSEDSVSPWDYRHKVFDNPGLKAIQQKIQRQIAKLNIRPEQNSAQQAALWDLWRDDQIARDLDPLFKQALQSNCQHWICSNDLVALSARHWLNQQQIPQSKQPRLIGFDNVPETYQKNIDSFEFDMSGLAATMIDFVLRPYNSLYSTPKQIRLRGRFCRKF